MPNARRTIVALCALAGLTNTVSAAQVWVVAPTLGPGVDFTSVQAAVAAASPGDIVLVRAAPPGAYGGDLALGGKALTIVAETGAHPTELASFGRVTVHELAAGQTTALRGFALPGMGFWPFSQEDGTLACTSSPGTLLVEDCAITGTTSAVRAASSGWLGISKSTLTASSVVFGSWSAVGHGLTNAATTTTLHASEARGGQGAFMSVMGNPVALSGGAGIHVASGTLVAARSTLLGGEGGGSTYSSYFSSCVYSAGGFGMQLEGANALAHLLETQAQSGGAGLLQAPCTAPLPVPDVWSGPGTWTAPSGAAPVLDATALTREGQTLSVVLETNPGELGVLLVATSVQPLFVEQYYGPLVHPGAALLPLGVVPPAGSIGASAVIQELGAGVEGVVLYLQAASVDPTTLDARLSNVSVSVLVDVSL